MAIVSFQHYDKWGEGDGYCCIYKSMTLICSVTVFGILTRAPTIRISFDGRGIITVPTLRLGALYTFFQTTSDPFTHCKRFQLNQILITKTTTGPSVWLFQPSQQTKNHSSHRRLDIQHKINTF